MLYITSTSKKNPSSNNDKVPYGWVDGVGSVWGKQASKSPKNESTPLEFY
jgi:hypothetical protein